MAPPRGALFGCLKILSLNQLAYDLSSRRD